MSLETQITELLDQVTALKARYEGQADDIDRQLENVVATVNDTIRQRVEGEPHTATKQWNFNNGAVVRGPRHDMDLNPSTIPDGYSTRYAGKAPPGVGFQYTTAVRFRGGYGGDALEIFYQWGAIDGSPTTGMKYRTHRDGFDSPWGPLTTIRDSGNTTIDSNGNLKQSSPIVRIANSASDAAGDGFDDIGAGTANHQAAGATGTHPETGVYVLTGTEGLATDGVWASPFVVPEDGNGNQLVFVKTEQADDNTVTVRTYTRAFDTSTASFVAGDPVDLPVGKWIDLRLDEPAPVNPE